MKKILIASTIIAGLGFGIFNCLFSAAPKAWADAASLDKSTTTPVNTDLFTSWKANGTLQGINWTDLRHYIMTGVNWQCVNLSTGTGTWTSDAVCAK